MPQSGHFVSRLVVELPGGIQYLVPNRLGVSGGMVAVGLRDTLGT